MCSHLNEIFLTRTWPSAVTLELLNKLKPNMIGMIPTRYFTTVVTLESIGLPIWPSTFFLSIESNGAYMFLTRYRSIINLLLTSQLHVFWPPVRTLMLNPTENVYRYIHRKGLRNSNHLFTLIKYINKIVVLFL